MRAVDSGAFRNFREWPDLTSFLAEQLDETPPTRPRRACPERARRPTAGDTDMTNDYDAIVVGARCAGSPTAMLLARKGYRVLVVDRASFPSDTLSTHVIHAAGRRRAPPLGPAR